MRFNVMRFRWVACVALMFSAAFGALLPHSSLGQEVNFAGSAQGSYLYVPTDSFARDQAFDGFTTELSLKVSADINEYVSVQAKACYACHGFELGLAFIDLRAHDAFSVRVGRFNPSFGEFPLRHDPANHRTVDKPLVYDMGRMLRMPEYNLGIFPAPYVDNGVEVSGLVWFGESVRFDYAAYAVGGFRGPRDAFDIDWVEQRSGALYYVDNNSRPAVGGRMSLAWEFGDSSSVSAGASAMWGTYDPDAELEYLVLGADLAASFGDVNIRAEYLIRRTEMGLTDNPVDRFRFGPNENGVFDDYFLKDGFYVELEAPIYRWVELVARFDGLRRLGNVARTSPLSSRSAVLRYTAGINVVPVSNVRIKIAGEFYDFSDFSDEVGVLGAVAASF